MSKPNSAATRLAESVPGMLIAGVLSLLWVISMAVVDGHAFTFVPMGWGILLAIVLFIIFVASGYKIVRFSLTAWLTVAVAAYFVYCCRTAPGLVSGWMEESLVLGGLVFYLFGFYAAQAGGNRVLCVTLWVAVLANVGAWWLLQDHAFSIRELGRAEVTLCGANTRNTSLLVYKNFAGLAFVLFGMLLIWRAVWQKRHIIWRLTSAGVGIVGVLYSFVCDTRIPYVLLPVMVLTGCLLWGVMRIFSGKQVKGRHIVALVLVGVAIIAVLVDLFLGHQIFSMVNEEDTHIRSLIWSEAWRYVGDAPLCGYGSASAQWIVSATYPSGALPNYIHNEYIQVWLDYGIVGAVLLLLLFVWHMGRGICILASEHVTESRRSGAALAILCVVGIALPAVSDYVWHRFSFVCVTAFAFGVLASPFPRRRMRLFDFRYWDSETRNKLLPIKAETGVGKVCVLLTVFCLGGFLLGLCLKLTPGWQRNMEYDHMVEQGASSQERRAFIAESVEVYPDSRLMDHYASLDIGMDDWAAYESALERTLQYNPQQIFTAAMLADAKGRMGKFEEAEQIFRRYYPGDGPDNTELYSWAMHYATNLMALAQRRSAMGQTAIALSMLEHADSVFKSGPRPRELPPWRFHSLLGKWVDGATKQRRVFLQNCREDIKIFRAIGIQPDDSWMAPMQPGGKPALYSRYRPAVK